MRSSISSSDAAGAITRLFLALGLSVAVLAAVTEWLVRDQVLPQDTLAGHLTLLQNTQSADVAFGDSHAARGFAAGDGFVNLAFPSETITHMAWKARRHFDDIAPGRVILQADPHLFAPYRLNARFKPYPELDGSGPAILEGSTSRHRPRLVAYWKAFLRNWGHLSSRVEQTADGSLLSPGDISKLPVRKRIAEARRRVLTHGPGPDSKVRAAQAEYAALVDFLRGQGADVCLVSYPVSQDYLDAFANFADQRSSRRYAELIDWFTAQARRTGSRYVDARQMMDQARHFRDTDHLNAEGAVLFTPRLIDACFG